MEAPLALYRRYRPETFAEVIGQDHVTAPLRNALSNNRVNHAYLFSGPRGCGKTTSARILARAINCEKGPIAEPCGVCKSCTDLARGGPGSIDVIEIDAASHGGVDDARDLRERAFFAPVESRYKIYIIDEAHMVTTQGFNALLKLVEEPPPHLKFIFATTEPDKVIGTIRSRTHHYPFRLVPPKVLADYMAQLCESEGVAIESAALPLVVRAGAGSVRDSLSVLDQLIGGAGPEGVTYELAVALLGFTPDSLLDACVDGFAAHDSAAVFETIEKVIETGQDPKRFAEDLLRRLRDLVVLSAVPNAITSGLIEAAEDQGERLQTQAAGIGAAELTRAADIVAAGLLEMRGATAPRLQLELICAKVLLPGADDSTNGIQARLDRMERRLTIGVPTSTPDSAPTSADADALSGRASARAASSRSTSPTGAPGAPTADAAGPSAPSTDAGTAGAGGDGAAGAWRDGAGSGTTGRASAGSDSPAGGAGSRAGAAADVAGAGSGRSAAGADAGVGAAGAGTDAGAGRAAAGAGAESGAGRTGAWGDESAAAGGASGATDGAEQTAGTSGAAGTGSPAGSVGLADIRRLWPEVLEAVKSKRRFAWIMLSQNAQVIAIDDQTLTLGLVNAGARESFARSGSDEILRQAMIDTIGLNRRVEAVVDPSADPGAGGQHTGGPRSGAPRSGGPTAGGTGPAGRGSPGGPSGRSDANGPDGAGGPGGAGASSGAGGSGGASDPGVGSSAGGDPDAGAAGGPGSGAPSGGGSGSGGPGTGGAAAGGSGARGAATGGAAGAGATGRAAGGGASDQGTGVAGAGAGGQGTGGVAGAGAGGQGAGGVGGPSAGGRIGGGAAGARIRQEGGAGGPGAGGVGAGGAGSSGVGAGGSGQSGVGAGVGGQGSGGPGARGAGAGGVASGRGGASGPNSPRSSNPSTSGSRTGGWGAGEVGGSGGGGARSGAWREGAAVVMEEPPDSEYDVPPEPDPWEEGPAPAVSKRRAAEAAVAAEQARRAAAVKPVVPLTPEEEAAEVGDDDMVLEEDSQSHTDLLRETLGAQIITEEPN